MSNQDDFDNVFGNYIRDDYGFSSAVGMFMGIDRLVQESERKKKQKMRELADSMTEDEIDLYNEGIRLKNIEIDKYNAELKEKRRIRQCVIDHICPSGDGGVLERGSKEKDNNYRRSFICPVCGSRWYRED